MGSSDTAPRRNVLPASIARVHAAVWTTRLHRASRVWQLPAPPVERGELHAGLGAVSAGLIVSHTSTLGPHVFPATPLRVSWAPWVLPKRHLSHSRASSASRGILPVGT